MPTTVPPGPTTTTTRPEYSFDDSVPPPKLLNTGTDYPAIVKSLGEYGNWLAAHRPDPELARRILAPGSQLLLLYSRDLVRLRDNGKRLVEQVRAPGTYTVISTTADAFSIRAEEHIRFHETVDASGRVTSRTDFPEKSGYTILGVLSGGHWYLAATDEVRPPVSVQQ